MLLHKLCVLSVPCEMLYPHGGVAAQLGAIEAKASEAETLLGAAQAADELLAAGRADRMCHGWM